MKVFVVLRNNTDGANKTTMVEAVFSSRRSAEEWIGEFNTEEPSIKPWEPMDKTLVGEWKKIKECALDPEREGR